MVSCFVRWFVPWVTFNYTYIYIYIFEFYIKFSYLNLFNKSLGKVQKPKLIDKETFDEKKFKFLKFSSYLPKNRIDEWMHKILSIKINPNAIINFLFCIHQSISRMNIRKSFKRQRNNLTHITTIKLNLIARFSPHLPFFLPSSNNTLISIKQAQENYRFRHVPGLLWWILNDTNR